MAFNRVLALLAACSFIATASAAGGLSGNLNFGSPISNLPGFAKEEPFTVLEAASRRLLAKSDGEKWNSIVPDKEESDAVFAQGVASGDPFAKSVILWTRITRPNGKGSTAAVDWAVSKTKDFKKIEKTGSAVTSKDVDFTVKVEAKGLKPNTKYYYQWRFRPASKDQVRPCKNKKCEQRRTKKALQAVYSVVGTTRTLPRANEDIKRARIAFFGCSNLPTGFFTNYGLAAKAADRGEVDYHIHTGDYIYEYQTTGSALFSEADRVARTHQPQKEILTVSDYRTRHNQYNSDVDTRAMRRSAPLIPVWDDHEYANDAWKNGAENHQPATEGDWNERRLRALQVYYEMMPIRQADADNKQRIYRNFEIGSLIKLVMLDTRVIARDLQNKTAANDPDRTILGSTQTEYLKNQLLAADGRQTWKVLGQQVLFTHRCDSPSADQWDGYRSDQAKVVDFIAENRIDNTIVLTGDIHTHWANDIARYPCPNEPSFNYNNVTGAGSVAVEFVSSSITSGYNPTPANQATQAANSLKIRAANPATKYQEGFYKGFAVLDVTPTEAKSTWYFATDLTRQGLYDQTVTGESWKVRVGTNHLVRT